MSDATFVTGEATPVDRSWDRASAVVATIRTNPDGTFRMEDADGIDMGDPNDYQWKTLASFRRLQRALVKADGRRNASTVGLFETEQRHFTKRDGTLQGRWEAFPAFVEHMLVVAGTKDYGAETVMDRIAVKVAVLAQEMWG